MKKLLTILFAVALGLNLSAQTEYVDDWNPDIVYPYVAKVIGQVLMLISR